MVGMLSYGNLVQVGLLLTDSCAWKWIT